MPAAAKILIDLAANVASLQKDFETATREVRGFAGQVKEIGGSVARAELGDAAPCRP